MFAKKQFYETSIGSIIFGLQELQEADSEAQELKQQKANGYKKIYKILHYEGLLFIRKAIWMELISHHHDNPLAGNFGIKKTRKLLAWKYCWPILRHNVKAYVKDCDVCLPLKAVSHKPYGDFQLLLISIYQ